MQEWKYRFMLCFLVILEIASSFKFSTNNLLQSEDVKIYPTPSPNYEMKQPGFVYDRQLQLKFTFHNEIIELLLMSYEDERTDIAVYSLKATELYRIDVPDSNAEDTIVPRRYKGANASFSIACEWVPHSLYRCQVSGVFFNHGIIWGVVPLQIGERSQNKNSKFSSEKNVGSWHRIFKPPSKDTANWIWPKNLFAKEVHTFQSGIHRQKRSVKDTYIVELALLLHANVWNKFMDILPVEFTSHQIAYYIKEYYSEMTHGMDRMIKTMSSQDVRIGIQLTSITHTYENNAWSLFHDKHVNWLKFNTWVNEPANRVSEMCDHAILLTDEDIHGRLENSMCTSNSTSVIQELYGMQTAMRGVHAIASALGIEPDGKGNDCPVGDDYIMASYKFTAMDKMNTLNRFRFSECSKETLKIVLSQNAKSFCLLTESNITESYEDYFLLPSGQRLSASQQCKLRFGNDSDIYACEDNNFSNRDGFCADVACLREGRCTEMVPLEGTSCDSRRWCAQGYCRPNRLAPEIPMDCWLGDKPTEGPLLPGSKLVCKDIAYGFAYMCYDKRISAICCWTCYFLRSVLEGCQYGDRSADCWAKECKFYNQRKVNYDCCFTCRDVISGSYKENRWQIGLFILAAMSVNIHLS